MARDPGNQLESGGDSGFMLLFTTLMLILVSFFAVLVSRTNFDETKFAVASSSLQAAFGTMSGGSLPFGAESGVPVLNTGMEFDGPTALPGTEMARIRALLAPDVLDGDARIIHQRGKRIVSLSAGLLFHLDSAEITEKMAETLLAFSAIVKGRGISITVAGHTDNMPSQTEGNGDNWDISSRRALAVLDFLAEKGGLDRNELTAFSYAGTRPIHSNGTPRGRARNNRVDLVLDFSGSENKGLNDLADKNQIYNFQGFDFLLQNGF